MKYDLNFIIELMASKTGIMISVDKEYIISSKLQLLVSKNNLTDIDELITKAKQGDNEIITDIIDALAVNETSFYRDKYPFEILRQYILPQLHFLDPNKKEIKILCAACATGQEPYSLAMDFLEYSNLGFTCDILAIDISSHALSIAEKGRYNRFEIQRGLPIDLLNKYFTKVEGSWEIAEEVRRLVSFEQCNLLDNLDNLGTFDIIFCRNLMIYFNADNRKLLINNLLNIMHSNAYLIMGASENIFGFEEKLHKITKHNGIYISG